MLNGRIRKVFCCCHCDGVDGLNEVILEKWEVRKLIYQDSKQWCMATGYRIRTAESAKSPSHATRL